MLTVSHGGTPGVVFTFGYDAVGNILSRSETIGGNAAGTNTYVYDDLDRVTRLEQSGTGVTAKRVDLAYNALGQYTTITRYADLAGTQELATSTYGYDLAHRLTSLTHAEGGGTLAAYTWTYDAASRITGMNSPVDGNNTLTYDAAGQLTGSTLTGESYTYDGTGNRTNTGYTTGDNNRLLSDGTYSYSYDDEGNRTSRSKTGEFVEYAWDHRNRLTQVTFKTSSTGSVTKKIEYDYDTADGRIAKRVDDNGDGSFERTERFVYTGGNVALEFDGAGSLTNRYLHGPGIDEFFADENAVGEVLWGLSDHQGTVRDLVEYDAPTGTTSLVNHVEYDSFGKITAQSSPADEPHFAYTGQEWDADAELYYYDARWYDPQAGRFISEDPSGLEPDANLYRYVENSPWNYTDPTGRVLSKASDMVVASLGQAFNAAGQAVGNFLSNVGSTFSWIGSVFGGSGLTSARTGGPLVLAPPTPEQRAANAAGLREYGLPPGNGPAQAIAPVSMFMSPAESAAWAQERARMEDDARFSAMFAEMNREFVSESEFTDAYGQRVIRTEWSDGSVTYESGKTFESGRMVGSRFVSGSETDFHVIGAGPSSGTLMGLGVGFLAPAALGGQYTTGTFGRALGEEAFTATTGLPFFTPGSFVGNTAEFAARNGDNFARSGTDVIHATPPSSPRTITPYPDPQRPSYNNAAIHQDHVQARSLDGPDTSWNKRPEAAETNLRKGGYEGQLKAYEQYLRSNGMSPQAARSVIQSEIDALRNSVVPRPMNPRILDQLPANPLH